MSTELNHLIANMGMNEPKSNLDVVDLWSEDNFYNVMSLGGYIKDKKQFKKFNFYRSMEHLKTVKNKLLKIKEDEIVKLSYRKEYVDWLKRH
jgi:hypothetical protein